MKTIKLTENDIEIEISKLQLEPNDVLVVKLPKEVSFNRIEAMVEVLSELANRYNIAIITATQQVDIEHVSERDMNKLGWYKFTQPH